MEHDKILVPLTEKAEEKHNDNLENLKSEDLREEENDVSKCRKYVLCKGNPMARIRDKCNGSTGFGRCADRRRAELERDPGADLYRGE